MTDTTTTTGQAAASAALPASIAEVLERITALQPSLRERAPEGEELRRVPDASIDELRAAGAFRIGMPKRYGGYEGNTQDMLDAAATAAYGDGGAAWVVTLANVCGWLASLFSRQAQDDIWGNDPDALVTGVLAPTATAVRVEGGYRVTGSWGYNSGSVFATWAGLGIPIPNEAGEIVSQGLVLIPRTDYEIEDTWFVAGMRASASNTIIANDVFVPDHRVLLVPEALEGKYANEYLADEPTRRSAFVPLLAIVLIGAQLGLARAALDYVIEKTHGKPISYSFIEEKSTSVGVQIKVARAAQLLDSAELHAQRAARTIDEAAVAGPYPDPVTRARVRADTATVSEYVLEVINSLISVHGAGAFAETNRLQRIWRDANVAARHAVVNPEISMEAYGKLLLGDETPVTPLI